MINVLYTVNGLRVNGMSAVIMQYISGLSKEKYRFTLFTDEIADQFMERLNENRVEVIQSKSRKKNQIAYYLELCRILKSGKYDIVHAHGNSATIAVEMLAAKQCGVPVRIAHSHNTTCTHKIVDKMLRPLFFSTYTHGIGCGVEAGKWLFKDRQHVVIKNGIDLNHFRFSEEARDKIRYELQISDRFVCGHVGRFTDQKNHDAILRIFKELIQSRDAVLLLVGDGPREEEIKELVKKMGIQKNVIFYGTTSDTSPLYSAMDIFLFPSKYEGVPLTLIEAQANGLPCVISDTISPEVSLTSLISVLPLENEAIWAQKLEIQPSNRSDVSNNAIRELTNYGFEAGKVIDQVDTLYYSALECDKTK